MSDITDLKAEVLLLYKENAELREQTELLITLLRNDCDIEASWDDLRKFWNIGLTESGCLMRDRACKAEAENAKLRELVKHTWLFANRAHEAAYELCPDRSDPHALATISVLTLNAQDVAVRMRELGVEV